MIEQLRKALLPFARIPLGEGSDMVPVQSLVSRTDIKNARNAIAACERAKDRTMRAYWDRVHEVEADLCKRQGRTEASISTEAHKTVNAEWGYNPLLSPEAEQAPAGATAREAGPEAIAFARDLAALATDENRRRTASLSALILQAQHICRLVSAEQAPERERADEGERCAVCGRRATWGIGGPDRTYWFAPNELWNEVTGHPPGLILCALHFEQVCHEKGIGIGWRAGRIGEIEELAEQAPHERELREALKHAEREALAIHASVEGADWVHETALSIVLQARAALAEQLHRGRSGLARRRAGDR